MRALSCLILFLLAGVSALRGQQVMVHASVTDSDGRAVVGARVALECGGQHVFGSTDGAGRVEIAVAGCTPFLYRASSPGFADAAGSFGAGGDAAKVDLAIELRPAPELTSVSVTASRSALAAEASATSTVNVSQSQLQNTPALTLDDKLRQIPGLELFRRSSSRVANPTSQGVSLRGLGSTAASRTLVLNDLVPLNDPFGGWIHWNEVPALAVDRVEVARGGGSDLYGSSAIGGVINFVTANTQPATQRYAFTGGYGGENTPFGDGLWTGGGGKFSGLAAASILRTEGYILTAPTQRGAVDVPANVHYQSGRAEVARALSPDATLFLRGNVYNEARSNGTVLQTNATRLWRYAGGGDFSAGEAGAFAVRLYGSNEHYRQSFSAVAAGRATERLTRLLHTPAQEVGAAVQWTKSPGPHWTLLAGTDVRDVRGTDDEVPIAQGLPAGLLDISTRQREVGGYAEVLFDRGPWSIAVSARGDRFSNLDTRKTVIDSQGGTVSTRLPDRDETVGDPRLGVVRRLGSRVAVSASGFRAFRSATMNELYRTGQVGQEITLPNSSLESERATGWETGALLQLPGHDTALRASYFYTQANRPITALTLSTTPTQITNMRENLGQLRSRGVSLDFETRPARWVTLTGGYQYADATVTKFKPQPQLIGKWLPQVPRSTGAAQAIFNKRQWGTLVLAARGSGRQFDDDQNTFLLHSFFRFDVYAEHEFGEHFKVYTSVENIADRAIEVGRTPLLTLGQPRTLAIGLRFVGAAD